MNTATRSRRGHDQTRRIRDSADLSIDLRGVDEYSVSPGGAPRISYSKCPVMSRNDTQALNRDYPR